MRSIPASEHAFERHRHVVLAGESVLIGVDMVGAKVLQVKECQRELAPLRRGRKPLGTLECLRLARRI